MLAVAAITDIRTEWNALRLEILVPAKLTDADFEDIIWARQHPSGKKFRNHLPLVVARFKSAVKKDIMERAPKHSNRFRSTKYSKLYRADIIKINYALFGRRKISHCSAFYGRFQSPFARYIHSDNINFYKAFPYAPVYIARLGALPTWIIRGEVEFQLPKRTIKLIQKQQNALGGARAEEFRQKLCDQRILRPSRLGDVTLMLGGDISNRKGTLHCSSLVPRRGKNSAFFYCRATFLDRPSA